MKIFTLLFTMILATLCRAQLIDFDAIPASKQKTADRDAQPLAGKFVDFDAMPESSPRASAAQASTPVDSFVPDPAPADKPQNSGTVALSTKPPSVAAQKGISPKGATWSDYVSVFLIWLIEASVPSCFLYAICWVFMRKRGDTTISISASWHTLGITFAAVTSALARMATVVLLGGGVGANPKGDLHTFYFVVIPMLSAIIAISFLKKRKKTERSQN